MPIIRIPAAQFADFDDCLTAAADAVTAELGLEGWDLSPRWADDAREEILVDTGPSGPSGPVKNIKAWVKAALSADRDAREADAIADQAIARSLTHTEIVTLDDAPGLRDALLVRCDDNVESQDGDGDSVAEYWGTDVAGSSWRVHVRLKA